MKIENPSTDAPVERRVPLASLLPREASSSLAYASNGVDSGRAEGLFALDSLFSLRVARGATVAYYFNATADCSTAAATADDDDNQLN